MERNIFKHLLGFQFTNLQNEQIRRSISKMSSFGYPVITKTRFIHGMCSYPFQKRLVLVLSRQLEPHHNCKFVNIRLGNTAGSTVALAGPPGPRVPRRRAAAAGRRRRSSHSESSQYGQRRLGRSIMLRLPVGRSRLRLRPQPGSAGPSRPQRNGRRSTRRRTRLRLGASP